MASQALPHHYGVNVTGAPEQNLGVSVTNLPDLVVAPPAQYGGPGNQWSPEDLFMASISSCLVLTFKATARASSFRWLAIECSSEGLLDKANGKTQFTKVITTATLTIPASESSEKAERLLHKAEENCLVVNSITTESQLKCVIKVAS